MVKRVGGFAGGKYRTIRKEIEVFSYPPNFKYFIKNIKPRFSVNVSRMREAALKNLLK